MFGIAPFGTVPFGVLGGESAPAVADLYADWLAEVATDRIVLAELQPAEALTSWAQLSAPVSGSGGSSFGASPFGTAPLGGGA